VQGKAFYTIRQHDMAFCEISGVNGLTRSSDRGSLSLSLCVCIRQPPEAISITLLCRLEASLYSHSTSVVLVNMKAALCYGSDH